MFLGVANPRDIFTTTSERIGANGGVAVVRLVLAVGGVGDEPVVMGFASGDAMIELAAKVEHRDLVTGSFEQHIAVDRSATPSEGSA